MSDEKPNHAAVLRGLACYFRNTSRPNDENACLAGADALDECETLRRERDEARAPRVCGQCGSEVEVQP